VSANGYARAQAREKRAAVAMYRGLGRSMRIAGATAYVSTTTLTWLGEPRFETSWSPAVPERFTQLEIALFLAFRLRAVVDIRAQLGFELQP
jgi:hypothetical protein